MLRVSPAARFRFEQRVGALAEGDTAGLCAPLDFPRIKRVYAVSEKFTEPRGLFPCLGERQIIGATESRLALPAVQFVEKNPPLGAGAVNSQIKVASIGMAPRLRHCRDGPHR